MYFSAYQSSVCLRQDTVYTESMMSLVDRLSERLDFAVNAHNTDVSPNAVEPLYAVPSLDSRQPFLFRCRLWFLYVVAIIACDPADTYISERYIGGIKRVTSLHVLYERGPIGTGRIWFDHLD